MWLLNGTISSFLVALPALFSIVNPLGGAFIYSQVTASRAHAERVALAWRVASYSAGVMLVALWAGATIMSFFGVSLSALRIAGGLVVAVRAWEMLSAPEENEDRKQEQAAPASGAGDVAFFPLTMPFTTGPVHHLGRDRTQRQPALGHARPHSAFRRSFGRGGDGRRHGRPPVMPMRTASSRFSARLGRAS